MDNPYTVARTRTEFTLSGLDEIFNRWIVTRSFIPSNWGQYMPWWGQYMPWCQWNCKNLLKAVNHCLGTKCRPRPLRQFCMISLCSVLLLYNPIQATKTAQRYSVDWIEYIHQILHWLDVYFLMTWVLYCLLLLNNTNYSLPPTKTSFSETPLSHSQTTPELPSKFQPDSDALGLVSWQGWIGPSNSTLPTHV